MKPIEISPLKKVMDSRVRGNDGRGRRVKNTDGLSAADIVRLCGWLVAERRRAKKRGGAAGLQIALACVDRTIEDLLFDLHYKAAAAELSDGRFLLEATADATEESVEFADTRSPAPMRSYPSRSGSMAPAQRAGGGA